MDDMEDLFQIHLKNKTPAKHLNNASEKTVIPFDEQH